MGYSANNQRGQVSFLVAPLLAAGPVASGLRSILTALRWRPTNSLRRTAVLGVADGDRGDGGVGVGQKAMAGRGPNFKLDKALGWLFPLAANRIASLTPVSKSSCPVDWPSRSLWRPILACP